MRAAVAGPNHTKAAAQDLVRAKLAAAASILAVLKRDLLDTLKGKQSRLEQDDFLWHGLLESFATMGGAGGWKGLIGNTENYERLRYSKLERVPRRKRIPQALKVCRDAQVRYPGRKAEFIVGCFDRIEALGGLNAATERLLNEPGRDAKVSFLMSFPGIGNKYARNLMMDVYHPDFRESIAIDTRIKKVSDEWQLAFGSYPEHEAFYLSVAHLAGMNGWELDRLMFWHQGVFFPPISMPVR